MSERSDAYNSLQGLLSEKVRGIEPHQRNPLQKLIVELSECLPKEDVLQLCIDGRQGKKLFDALRGIIGNRNFLKPNVGPSESEKILSIAANIKELALKCAECPFAENCDRRQLS
jgi:hypothetical protein